MAQSGKEEVEDTHKGGNATGFFVLGPTDTVPTSQIQMLSLLHNLNCHIVIASFLFLPVLTALKSPYSICLATLDLATLYLRPTSLTPSTFAPLSIFASIALFALIASYFIIF